MASRESEIRQVMYEIFSGKRMIKGDASKLGGSKGDKGETLDKLGLTAIREYPVGQNYVTTKIGYKPFWTAWLKIEHQGIGKMLGLGPDTSGSRISKVKQFDDFANNRYTMIGQEDDSNIYTGWVFGDRERAYKSLDEASRDISERAVEPFLTMKRRDRGLMSKVKADLELDKLNIKSSRK